MNCNKCGSPLNATDLFCKGCGTPTSTTAMHLNGQAQVNNMMNSQNNMEQPTEVLNLSSITQPTNVQADANVAQPINTQLGNVTPTNNFNNNINQQPIGRPIYNNQQSFNPNMGYQNNNSNMETNNSSNKMMTIMIVVGAVLALAIIAVVTLYFTGAFDKNNKDNDDIVEVQTTKVGYGGYTFSIPDKVAYEIKDNVLYLMDQNQENFCEVVTLNVAYQNIVTSMANMKPTLENKGLVANSAAEKTLNGAQFVTVEVEQGGSKLIYAYTRASSTQIFVIATYGVSNEHDYSMLEEIAPILKSAVYVGGTSNIGNDKISINDAVEAIK